MLFARFMTSVRVDLSFNAGTISVMNALNIGMK